MQVGQRVRLKNPVEIDWEGTMQPGITGTVRPFKCGPDDSTIGYIQLDEPHPFLEGDGRSFWISSPEWADTFLWNDWEAIG